MRLARLAAAGLGAGVVAGFGAGLLHPRRPELRPDRLMATRPPAAPAVPGSPADHPDPATAATRAPRGPVM